MKNSFESMFDFLILNTLSQESLGGFAPEQRVERIRKMLEWLAERKGKNYSYLNGYGASALGA